MLLCLKLQRSRPQGESSSISAYDSPIRSTKQNRALRNATSQSAGCQRRGRNETGGAGQGDGADRRRRGGGRGGRRGRRRRRGSPNLALSRQQARHVTTAGVVAHTRRRADGGAGVVGCRWRRSSGAAWSLGTGRSRGGDGRSLNQMHALQNGGIGRDCRGDKEKYGEEHFEYERMMKRKNKSDTNRVQTSDAFRRSARILVSTLHSFMFLVLFCLNSAHFSEIQLV